MVVNIAGYKFVYLENTKNLREDLLKLCQRFMLKGTILLSDEGININLAGDANEITSFKHILYHDSRFNDISFHETFSETIPFKRLKVKLKKEIITLRKPETTLLTKRAPSISPKTLKEWLDTNQDFTLLDMRNAYEIRFGTFDHAKHLSLTDFCQFPDALDQLDQNKPIVMFCTGGIRCEKAAVYLLTQQTQQPIYQLEGGILAYFAQVGGAHYHGECFVFDERVSLDTNLKETGTKQCTICQGPIPNVLMTDRMQCAACVG